MSYPARYLRCSNLLTYLSLLSGLLAVIVARQWRSWEYSGVLLAVSAFADTFDGRFARLFSRSESEKAFGAQLDSLVDAFAFGIAPVVCLQSLVRRRSSRISDDVQTPVRRREREVGAALEGRASS